MEQKTKVKIIILDYKKAVQVLENVKTLLQQRVNFLFQIFVVDNSCDEENAQILKKLEKYPQVKVCINEKNFGYTKAHNQLHSHIDGDYILIVNPDILWHDTDTLQRMVDFMDKHPQVGIMGPKQINHDGSVAMTVRAFPKLHLQISRRTFLRKLPFISNLVAYDEMQHLNYSKAYPVDWIQSSCVIIRKDLWDQTRGFDEDYFIFMADVELCFQAWKKGFEVVYLPQLQVYADGERASKGGFKKFFQSWVLRQHFKDALKYQVKHLGEKNPREEFLRKQSSCVDDLHFYTKMKGIILAGGAGSRLFPLTKVTSKQLLPIYNKPMIYYPIETLAKAGIKEILIIVARDNAGDFLKLLGSGKEFGVRFTYEIQDKPEGIAQAFLIGENFIGKDNVTLALGDNIFEDDFSKQIQSFQSGAMIFTKEVSDPERFGVVETDAHGKVLSVEEKPKNPKSNQAQTGLYVFDNSVIQKTKNMKPSARGELEVTDVVNLYLDEGTLTAELVKGAWFDTGTHEAMFEATKYMRGKSL